MIMKKLVTVFAACAVAGMAMAQADSNIVGYTKVDPFNQYGAAWAGQNFVKCGGGSIQLTEMLDASALVAGDVIQFWDNKSVAYFGYMWTGGGWEDPDLNEVGTDIPDIDVSNSMGFFAQTVNPVTLAGEVSTNVTEVSLEAGGNLVSSLFPVPFDLDKCDFSALTPGDTIQVWDTTGLAWVMYMWTGAGFEDAELEEVTGVIAQPGEPFFVTVTGGTSYTQTPPTL